MQPIRLLDDSLRIPIEKVVSEHTGYHWKVSQFENLNDLASHQCAILSNGSYAVFAKLSEAANGVERFEAELAGLRLLSECSGVLTPTAIKNVEIEGGVIMLLKAVPRVERTPHHWRQIGQALARIHRVKGTQFGLSTQGYFGPLYQDNRPMQDWPFFFAERRLWPRLMGAIDSGHMPTEVIRQVEKVIAHLAELCGPATVPTLLHGDAQQNNYISTDAGVVVIDPAVYYGHPEVDLAHLDYFEPVPDDVFVGYEEELPIDSGFSQRRELWRIPSLLAAVTVAGPKYLDWLTDALRKYL